MARFVLLMHHEKKGTGKAEGRSITMLRFQLHMQFATAAFAEAHSALRSLVGPVRAEPGCGATRLFINSTNPHSLTWSEEWNTTENFKHHLHAKSFQRILAVMELASGPPTVEIDDVASRRGFDMVEEFFGSRGSVITSEKEHVFETSK